MHLAVRVMFVLTSFVCTWRLAWTLRLARLIVEDLQTAEDVTQDTYLGAIETGTACATPTRPSHTPGLLSSITPVCPATEGRRTSNSSVGADNCG